MNSQLRKAFTTSSFTDPTSPQVRAIVLDYLCHNSYTNTARIFSRDSIVKNIDADGDEIMSNDCCEDDLVLSEEMLTQIEVRKEIQHKILEGRVDEAIELLNEHFPTVLRESPANHPMPARPSSPNTVLFVAPSSVDPAHLLLNLRILAFTEACRTVPLEYKPPGVSKESSDDSESCATMDDIDSLPSSQTGCNKEDAEVYDQHLNNLLFRIRKLYAFVNALKNPVDRSTFLEELGQVGGLLAYKVPEKSPMAMYLSQVRREHIADQINRAILYRTGLPAISKLELHTRYTTTLWSWMHDMRNELPPQRKWPPAVQPPPSSASNFGGAPSKGTSANHMKDSQENGSSIVPLFDLREFLDTKSS